jgi:serine/threonine protein kinase
MSLTSFRVAARSPLVQEDAVRSVVDGRIRSERVIAGKYRLVRLLGSGGMGTVYVAEHVQMRRSFALKFLRRDRSSTPRYLRRFEREAELLGRLEHENVVSLHDMGVDEADGPYLVLEYVRGITLREELERHGVRPVERVLPIVRQVARGLTQAHTLGIVHRDLKPENVMLAAHADGGLLVKLLDFGVAGLRDDEAERMTLSDTAIGTAAYMAPEQARGDRTLDARTDVYALGVITYETLSGVRPYSGDSYNETLFRILHRRHRPLAELRPELPAALVAAVERALAREVEARFATVEAFVGELEGAGPHVESAPIAAASLPSTSEGAALPVVRVPRGRRHAPLVVAAGFGAALGYGTALLSDEERAVTGTSTKETRTAGPTVRPQLAGPNAPRLAQATTPDPAARESLIPAATLPLARVPATRPTVSSQKSTPARSARTTTPPLAPSDVTPAPPAPDRDDRGYILFNPYPSLAASDQRP